MSKKCVALTKKTLLLKKGCHLSLQQVVIFLLAEGLTIVRITKM